MSKIKEIRTHHVDDRTNAVAIDVYFEDTEEGNHAADFDLDSGKVYWRDNRFRGELRILEAIKELYAQVPYKVGDRVRIIDCSDEQGDASKLFTEGDIVSFNVNGETGNTAEDPLLFIRFDDGSEDSFWREEVVRIPGGNCE